MRKVALVLILGGCGPILHEGRLADGFSISRGPAYFLGYAAPSLPPGVPLTEVRPGQRLVLWAPDGFEALVDVGESCEAIVREGEGARAPTEAERARLAWVLEGWPLRPGRPERYAEERGRTSVEDAGRLFPSHQLVKVMASPDPVGRALAASGGWMDRGGRIAVLELAAATCPESDLRRIARRAGEDPSPEDAARLGKAVLARRDAAAETLRILAGHPAWAASSFSQSAALCPRLPGRAQRPPRWGRRG